MTKNILALSLFAALSAGAQAATLTAPQTIQVGFENENVVIGDLNGDGVSEVALLAFSNPSAGYSTDVYLLGSDPVTGVRVLDSHQVTTDYTTSADLTLVKRVDQPPLLAVTRSQRLFLLSWDGAAWTQTDVTLPGDSRHVVAADLDEDGTDEVIVHGWSNGGAVYRLTPTGATLAYALPTPGAGYNDVDVGDFNGDGHLDFALMSGQGMGPSLAIFPGDGAGQLGAYTGYPAIPWRAGAMGVGDLDGDGRDDVVLAQSKNRPASLFTYYQTTTGTLELGPEISTYDIPGDNVIGDFDRDGSPDIVTVHNGWSALSSYERVEGEFVLVSRPPLPYTSWYTTRSVAADDLDGDGCDELVIANQRAGVVFFDTAECFYIPPPPPENDLTAQVVRTATKKIQITARSVAGTAPAEQTRVAVSMVVSRNSLQIVGPSDCAPQGGDTFLCDAGDLEGGQAKTFSFSVTAKKNAWVTIEAAVTSETSDPDPDNNTKSLTYRY